MIDYRVYIKAKKDGKKKNYSLKKIEIDSIEFTGNPKTKFFLFTNKKGKQSFFRLVKKGKNFSLYIFPKVSSTSGYGNNIVYFNNRYSFYIIPNTAEYRKNELQKFADIDSENKTYWNESLLKKNGLLYNCESYKEVINKTKFNLEDVVTLFDLVDSNCAK